jgi:hypothetical protein
VHNTNPLTQTNPFTYIHSVASQHTKIHALSLEELAKEHKIVGMEISSGIFAIEQASELQKALLVTKGQLTKVKEKRGNLH